MEGITIGQIAVALALVAGLITSVSLIVKNLKKFLIKTMQGEFDALKKDISNIGTKVDNVDLASSKDYLVMFLSNVEKGIPVDEIERQRFYERYEHYKHIGGNSYIRRKVEQLEAEKKL